MRTDNQRQSSNIEDRRGSRFPGGGKGGMGIGVIVLALAAAYFGIDPRIVMQGTQQLQSSAPAQESGPVTESAREKRARELVAVVLADTEDTWKAIFAAGGSQYREPTLVLFRDATSTGCGTGQAAMGPFYCSADEKVYIDLGFYDELQNRFKAPGDFAQAYVIAHEVGHHVQHLLGISGKVQKARQRLSEAQGNALSVKLELQADCLAGVWAYHAQRSRQLLEEGDIEEALTAATAIGDDTLQKQARGYAVPDSFTHGSSAQRVHWFKTGMNSGDLNSCNTFDSGKA
ncbi:MAG: neutral zinc metallopeptidase [Pedobacter sp.]|nr:neutral zinc metallopeptidase [Pedobacter sp.]